MTRRSQDTRRAEQGKAKESAALDAVKTKQQAEAEADKRRADEVAHEATRLDRSRTEPAADSPKRQGDALEGAVREAAGRPKRR